MAQHTGTIEGRSGNNILIEGKQFYVPPEKVWLFDKYPPGSSVTISEVKGTVSSIQPSTSTSLVLATSKTIPKKDKVVAIGASVRTNKVNAVGETVKTVIQAHQTQKNDSASQTIAEGTIISITIGGVLNLGNYSNVNLEVTATSAEVARTAFKNEISLTATMMQEVIRQIGVK